jgi:Zn-dependent protease
MGEFAQTFVIINMNLAIFNLIPVHPLDGGKIIAIFLPDAANRWLEENQGMFSFALLFLFLSGAVGKLIWTPIMYSTAFMLNFGSILTRGAM